MGHMMAKLWARGRQNMLVGTRPQRRWAAGGVRPHSRGLFLPSVLLHRIQGKRRRRQDFKVKLPSSRENKVMALTFTAPELQNLQHLRSCVAKEE